MTINAMGQGMAGSSSAGHNWISTLVQRMPYTYKIIQNAVEANPKYDTFHELVTRKEERVQQQSIFQQGYDVPGGMIVIDKRYHQLMYADVDTDKVRRIQEYRRMAAYAELADAIDEIADEALVKDEGDDIVKLELRGDHDEVAYKMIQAEWKKYVNVYDLENKGWEILRQFLVEGELFFENVISENRPDLGILGLVAIPTELINPIYDNIQNQVIKGFMLRKPVISPKRTITNQQKEELIVMDKNQVTYIHSGLWNEDRTIRLPYIENSRRAYKQLSLIEDSIVIYRLVRAPERLVFNVDVGTLPTPKVEEYLKKLMQQWWTRKNYETNQGRITNVYNPHSMLDAFWFAKRGQSEGTTVTTLPGGQNLGQLEDLMYFIKKLYKSLKVPVSRLDPADPFKDGTEITREELRFARFIVRIQAQIAQGMKQSFITHLKLREKEPGKKDSKSLWERFKLRENHIHAAFNTPTSFAIMREQQIFDLKKNNYLGLIGSELISQTFAQKYYLGLTKEQIVENQEWVKRDAALSWEMQQIIANGPDFRKQLEAEAQMDKAIAGMEASAGGGGGGTALPGGFQPQVPPEFGPGPQGTPAGGGGVPPQAVGPATSTAPGT